MFKMDIDGLKARLRTLEDQAVDQSSEIAKHSKNIDDMETSYKKFQHSIIDRDADIERLNKLILDNAGDINTFKEVCIVLADRMEDLSLKSQAIVDRSVNFEKELKEMNAKFSKYEEELFQMQQFGQRLHDSLGRMELDSSILREQVSNQRGRAELPPELEDRLNEAVKLLVAQETWNSLDSFHNEHTKQLQEVELRNHQTQKNMEESVEVLRSLLSAEIREKEEAISKINKVEARNLDLESRLTALTNIVLRLDTAEKNREETVAAGNVDHYHSRRNGEVIRDSGRKTSRTPVKHVEPAVDAHNTASKSLSRNKIQDKMRKVTDKNCDDKANEVGLTSKISETVRANSKKETESEATNDASASGARPKHNAANNSMEDDEVGSRSSSKQRQDCSTKPGMASEATAETPSTTKDKPKTDATADGKPNSSDMTNAAQNSSAPTNSNFNASSFKATTSQTRNVPSGKDRKETVDDLGKLKKEMSTLQKSTDEPIKSEVVKAGKTSPPASWEELADEDKGDSAVMPAGASESDKEKAEIAVVSAAEAENVEENTEAMENIDSKINDDNKKEDEPLLGTASTTTKAAASLSTTSSSMLTSPSSTVVATTSSPNAATTTTPSSSAAPQMPASAAPLNSPSPVASVSATPSSGSPMQPTPAGSPLVAPVGSQNAGSYAGYSINVYNQGLTYSQQPNFKQGLPMANVFSGYPLYQPNSVMYPSFQPGAGGSFIPMPQPAQSPGMYMPAVPADQLRPMFPMLPPQVKDPSSQECEYIPTLGVQIPSYYKDPKDARIVATSPSIQHQPSVNQLPRFCFKMHISSCYRDSFGKAVNSFKIRSSMSSRPVKTICDKVFELSLTGSTDDIKADFLTLHGLIAHAYTKGFSAKSS